MRRSFGSILLFALMVGVSQAAAQEAASIDQRVPTGPAAASPRGALEAAAQAGVAGSYDTEHMFGVGVRVGGSRPAIGGGLRYFFDGPLGIQVEITRYFWNFRSDDFGSTEVAPAVIYRFARQTFDAPLVLQPYAGGGISIMRSSLDDFFFPDDDDRTNVGALAIGGVELFFERAPRVGVSGELRINSNDDLGPRSFDRVSFMAAGHWYFR